MNINNLTIILLLYAFFDSVFLKKRIPLLNVYTTCPWSPGWATSHVLSCTLSYALYIHNHISSPLLSSQDVAFTRRKPKSCQIHFEVVTPPQHSRVPADSSGGDRRPCRSARLLLLAGTLRFLFFLRLSRRLLRWI